MQARGIMRTNGFVVAMAAEITLAAYHRPTAGLRTKLHWIIVSRCGPEAEDLTISNAWTRGAASEEAPIGIAPVKTSVGILLSDTPEESTFLLVRQVPEITIAGIFFPADGYARISGDGFALRLRSEGRHAHSLGRCAGQLIRKDVPDPAPGAKGTMAWHIEAARRAWSGEFIA